MLNSIAMGIKKQIFPINYWKGACDEAIHNQKQTLYFDLSLYLKEKQYTFTSNQEIPLINCKSSQYLCSIYFTN